jgi:hypothetical protein
MQRLEDIERSVGRAAVNDNVLERRVSLVDDAANGALNGGARIEARRDDRDQRRKIRT